ncbi:MAG: metal-dependent transcriptional regulator, partial [Clostridia bacterium]|nr:metal-dependent transcriptional regulator [Clostridia bacterium]
HKIANVRAIDVAQEMNFSKPSVSRALGILKNNGFIAIDKNGYISLSETGGAIAEKIYERHKVLTDIFTAIGVPEDIAQEDACKVEHAISDETFSALKRHQREKRS